MGAGRREKEEFNIRAVLSGGWGTGMLRDTGGATTPHWEITADLMTEDLRKFRKLWRDNPKPKSGL